jgi:inorganic pyrophosphatase
MTRSLEVPARVPGSYLVNVIVENPAGTRGKFKFDETHGLFLLHKMLPVGAAFPFDFGFVPSTRSEDGDPVDVMILGEEPTFTGCLVTVRLLGIIEAEQTEKGKTIRNDRLIGTAETDKIKPTARSLSDVPSKLLEQIEHFFVSYNRAEGREFVPLARRGPRVAMKQIEQGMSEYRRRGKTRRST